MSNLVAQTTMAPLLGFLLTRAGYARVYPVMGVLWMGLTLLAWRAGTRLPRENRSEPQAAVSQAEEQATDNGQPTNDARRSVSAWAMNGC